MWAMDYMWAVSIVNNRIVTIGRRPKFSAEVIASCPEDGMPNRLGSLLESFPILNPCPPRSLSLNPRRCFAWAIVLRHVE